MLRDSIVRQISNCTFPGRLAPPSTTIVTALKFSTLPKFFILLAEKFWFCQIFSCHCPKNWNFFQILETCGGNCPLAPAPGKAMVKCNAKFLFRTLHSYCCVYHLVALYIGCSVCNRHFSKLSFCIFIFVTDFTWESKRTS